MTIPAIPREVAEGVAELVRSVCNEHNNYRYITFMTIGNFNYKITIELRDMDPEKEAGTTTITIKREDHD